MARLSSISPVSLGLHVAFLTGLGSTIAAFIVLVAIDPSERIESGYVAMLPFVGFGAGFLSFAILALVYNWLAALTGGIEFRIALDDTTPAKPLELVLTIAVMRKMVGNWVILECETGGHEVPYFQGGEPVEVRGPETLVRTTVSVEERHVRTARPGRVAFTLPGEVSLEDVRGATEVRIII